MREKGGNKTKTQEKAYRKDFFKFAKKACNGSLEKEDIVPTFNETQANNFYSGRYSQPVTIDPAKLFWFPQVEAPSITYHTGHKWYDLFHDTGHAPLEADLR